MDIVTLQDGPVIARFAPSAGMIGTSLTDDGTELLGQRRGLDTYISAGKTMGLPLLYPWANRLSVNDFEPGAAGVRTDPNGLPIHGLLAARPDWEVVSQTAQTLVAHFDFAAHPELLASFAYPHLLEIAVTLTGRTLTLRTTVTATGDAAVPLCFGFHPYLQIPGVARGQWLVETPALRHLPVDQRGLPTGESTAQPASREVLGDRAFDDGYDQVADGAVFAVSGGDRRIEVQFLEGYPAAQIFAPPAEDLICFEPMAAPTDALTRGNYRAAAPGRPAVASFAITV